MKKLTFLLTLSVLFFVGCNIEEVQTIDEVQTLDSSNENLTQSRSSSGELFDMNDRFATEKTGANGFGKVFVTQSGGTIEVKLIQAKGLLPNHEYELQVTVDFENFYTSACFASNPSGHWKITNFELPANFDPGDYRVDLFVTHCEPTVPGDGDTGEFLTAFFDRDPLLSCEPFVIVTVK